jgi:hypothetical protein
LRKVPTFQLLEANKLEMTAKDSFIVHTRCCGHDQENSHHAANPMPYPPPVALDWLYVDVAEGDPADTKILVPPMMIAPGEQLL